MRFFSAMNAVVAAAAVGLPGLSGAAAAQTPLTTTRVVSGLVRPVWVTHAPRDFSRVFIIEKQGRIRIAQITPAGAYTLLPASFLDIDAIVTGGTTENSEQGLLGLAFHPNYPTDPRFFVYYTAVAGAGDEVVAAYTVSANPNIANTTGDVLMTWDDPQTNHNGGWITFGPGGLLYLACGDGGGANDSGAGHTEPGGNAQDITSNWMGKILRIDVNSDDFPADSNRDYHIPPTNPFAGATPGDDEIWAYGLRNPWRNDFDNLTGDLYIADVGQDTIEEINFQPASGPGIAGRNYGWRCYEGNNLFNFDSVCSAVPGGGFTFPIYTYTHASGCSITGGCVYRGCAVPDLQGAYFFADYCTAFIRSFKVVGGAVSGLTSRTAELAPGGGLSISSITSFGEDAFGEMYICDSVGGEVFKIIPATAVGPDCNGNGRRDACDILAGSSRDINVDSVPDECRCPADWDGNGVYNPIDVALFVNAWFTALSQGTLAGDYDGNGVVTPSDMASFVTAWFNALSGGSC